MRPYDPNKQQLQRSGVGGADGSSINDMSIQMTTAPSPMQLPHNSNNNTARKAPPLYQKTTTKHSSSANTGSFVAIYIWLTLLSVLTIWVFMRHPTPAAAPPGTTIDIPMVSSSSIAGTRGTAADTEETIHTYPFNVYDDTVNRIVRYPQTGGIPHLDWKRVRNFRACCKDDDNLRCFSTEEVALRRDPVRSSQGLSDVYLEIRQQSTRQQQNDENWRPIGSRGARCQLIWTACKVKVES